MKATILLGTLKKTGLSNAETLCGFLARKMEEHGIACRTVSPWLSWRCTMRQIARFSPIVALLVAAAAGAQDAPGGAARALAGYAEAWSAHDVERIASYFSEDARYEDVTLGEVHVGRPAIRAFALGTFEAIPGFAIEPRSIVGGDRWATVEWLMTGTDRATGKGIAVRGVSVMELEGGKIRRNTDYWDMATLLRQTGVLPGDSAGTSSDTAASRATDVAGDIAAVRATWEQATDALIRKDWPWYAQHWIQDSTLQVIHPDQRDWIAGWEAFARQYQALFAADAQWTAEMRRFDVQLGPSGDVAWATIDNTITMDGRPFRAWQVVVMKKVGSEWKIALGFSSPVPPEAAPSP